MASISGVGGIVTVANGATVSSAIDLGNLSVVGLILPVLTSTAITFQASDSLAGTYQAVKGSDGNSVSYTVASSTYVVILPTALAGIRFLKLVCGSAEGAARTITVIAKECYY